MTVQHIYSRVKKVFPDVTLAEVVALINDALMMLTIYYVEYIERK